MRRRGGGPLWVRGEDRMEPQALKPTEGLVVADLAAEARVGARDRVGGVLTAGLACALAQHSYALVLLGEVHQMEVAGERAGDLVGARDGERLGDRGGTGERVGGRILVRLDRRQTQALDVVEQVVAAGFAQN